jgi:Zn-dependent protease
LFNLVPGYPLDGGRLLRAGIWGITGNHRKATRIAAGMGQGVGVAMVIGGVSLAVISEPVNGIWLGIVGMFLFSMARSRFPE